MRRTIRARLARIEKRLADFESPDSPSSRQMEAARLHDQDGLTYRDIGNRFGVSSTRAQQLASAGRRVPSRIILFRQLAEDEREVIHRLSGVSGRIANVLGRRGVTSWSQVNSMTDDDLLAIPNVGRLTVREIRATAEALSLAYDP